MKKITDCPKSSRCIHGEKCFYRHSPISPWFSCFDSKKGQEASVEQEEKLKVTEISVKDLKPYEKNTKKHDKTQIVF